MMKNIPVDVSVVESSSTTDPREDDDDDDLSDGTLVSSTAS